MSGSDLPPGPAASGGEYPASPPPDPDPGYTDPLSETPALGETPAGPYPPGAGPYPPGNGPYPLPPGAYPPPPYEAAYPYAPQTGNGYAITALVVGLVSIVVFWFPFVDWVLAAVAIIFGAVGISTAGRRGGTGKGMAVAGLVLGLVTAVLGITFWVMIYGGFTGSQCAYAC
jgi:hypothetical protein